MKKNSTQTAAVAVPPPLLFLTCLGVAFFMNRMFPINMPDLPGSVQIIAGGLFSAASAVFGLGALAVMASNKTPFNPAKQTLVVVKNGPFQFSRNPMYLSLVLLMIGFTFFQSSLWYLGATLVLFFLLTHLAIKPEEQYLAEKFGQQYLDYKARVRRWI